MIDLLYDASWRGYPAAALVLAGLVIIGQSMMRRDQGATMRTRAGELRWVQGFRLSMLGLAFVGTGLAWAWQVPWLVIASLAIAGEEILESSVMIAAWKRGERAQGRTTAT